MNSTMVALSTPVFGGGGGGKRNVRAVLLTDNKNQPYLREYDRNVIIRFEGQKNCLSR